DESRLVLNVEGKRKPRMPPKTAKQPTPAEAAVLRAWVFAGAKDDTGALKVVLPPIKPRRPLAAPVAAVAYLMTSRGEILAAGGNKEVVFVDPQSGTVTGRLSGLPGAVTALASLDRLAVATGDPGTAGEVRLYALQAGSPPKAQLERTLAAHGRLVRALAF